MLQWRHESGSEHRACAPSCARFAGLKGCRGAPAGAPDRANNRSTWLRSTNGFYGGKIDAIVADGHRLEGAYFTTTQITNTLTTVYNSEPDTHSAFVGETRIGLDGESHVGRHRGTFAPWAR